MFFILKRAISREVPHCGGKFPLQSKRFRIWFEFHLSDKKKTTQRLEISVKNSLGCK